MPLLQIHQAKALKDLYKGGHDPEVLQELRTIMDLTLRAMKIIGKVQCPPCRPGVPCLAANKMWFLNSSMSQTGLFGDALESFAQQFSGTQKTEAIKCILPGSQLLRPPDCSTSASLSLRACPHSHAAAAASTQAASWSQGPAKQKPGGKRKTKRP